MYSIRLTRVVAVLCVVVATNYLRMPTACAQGYDSDGAPIQGHIMGGYSATSGNDSDNLQGGWIFDGGVTFWPQGGPLGIRADLSYSNYGAGNNSYYFAPLAYGYKRGWGDVSSIAAGLVFRPHQYGWGRFYGLAQVSGSDVQLRLRQYAYCTSFNCPFTPYNVDDYGATKIGVNVGLGVDFPIYRGTSWFVEG
jgi:hypothetical protein